MASVTSVISIEGMTCQSCVRNIEGVVGALPGVHSVKVDLEGKRGTVIHNPKVVLGAQISDRIDDMGFEARLLGKSETQVDMEGKSVLPNGRVKVENLLGETVNCACGDQLVQISVKGEAGALCREGVREGKWDKWETEIIRKIGIHIVNMNRRGNGRIMER